MARRNKRSDAFEPIDYTGVTIPLNIPTLRVPGQRETPGQYAARQDERRQREDRQRTARIAQGIDWDICMVLGCGSELRTFRGSTAAARDRDPSMTLPMCFDHMAVVFKMAVRAYGDHPDLVEAVAELNHRVAERNTGRAEKAKVARLANVTRGDIYFVRLGGLVKVGWTRDLRSRLKSYGASAELLVSYPASRDDETNLHRQLTPARAKGREWYEDGPVIAKFLDEALAQYGMPKEFEGMWTTPKQVVAGKRVMRYR